MLKKKKQSQRNGFTLVELIVVIAIIGIAATITIVAINPAKQLAEARNTARHAGVDALLEAITQYQWDNGGNIPPAINAGLQMLGTAGSGCDVTCEGGIVGEGDFEDDTEAEFNAGTYSDTQYDAGNAWVELNATGLTNGTGSFTSEIKDAGTSSTWSGLAWSPAQPFYKEAPGSAQSESGYLSGNVNMTDNVLLYHLNESSGTIVDSSGNGNNGTVFGGVTYSATGKLNGALDFNGTSGYVAIQNLNYNTNGEIDELTVCAWFNTTFGGSGQFNNWAIVDFDRSEYYNFFVYGDTGELGFATEGSSSGIDDMRANTSVNDGQWHFGCAVFDASITNDKRIYLDGVLDDEQDGHATSENLGSGLTRFGFLGDGSEASSFNGGRNNFYYDGLLDEVMIFHRALPASEILALYRRGGNRLLFQVRSCDDAACSGESFIGPDGTGSTYYSELSNTTLTTPSLSLTNVPNNQYFQYQATFDTDSGSFSPELTSVSIFQSSGSATMTSSTCLDLSADLEPYIPEIPEDPSVGSQERSYYAIQQSASGRGVNIVSCGAELNEVINGSR